MGDKKRIAELEERVAQMEREIRDLRMQLLHSRKPEPLRPYGPSEPYRLPQDPWREPLVTITCETTGETWLQQQPLKEVGRGVNGGPDG